MLFKTEEICLMDSEHAVCNAKETKRPRIVSLNYHSPAPCSRLSLLSVRALAPSGRRDRMNERHDAGKDTAERRRQ